MSAAARRFIAACQGPEGGDRRETRIEPADCGPRVAPARQAVCRYFAPAVVALARCSSWKRLHPQDKLGHNQWIGKHAAQEASIPAVDAIEVDRVMQLYLKFRSHLAHGRCCA